MGDAQGPGKGVESEAPLPSPTLRAVWPGLGLASGIAIVAYLLNRLPDLSSFSPLILAILLGMACHNLLGTPAAAGPGLAFSQRRLLRLGVVLLGLRITTGQLLELGLLSLALVLVALVTTFVFTIWLGRMLGVEEKLATLLAAGTSVCGASAVVATSAVAGGRDEDVAYAVACVTLFGTAAMILYPLLPGLLELGPETYGLWAGASIHEVAQVVAASFQNGVASGETGTIAKLGRVILLAPMLVLLAATAYRGTAAAGRRSGTTFPWFVIGFVALVAANSVITIPETVRTAVIELTGFLFTVALAAVGLGTNVSKIREAGPRPLLLGAMSWLFIAGTSLLMIKLAW